MYLSVCVCGGGSDIPNILQTLRKYCPFRDSGRRDYSEKKKERVSVCVRERRKRRRQSGTPPLEYGIQRAVRYRGRRKARQGEGRQCCLACHHPRGHHLPLRVPGLLIEEAHIIPSLTTCNRRECEIVRQAADGGCSVGSAGTEIGEATWQCQQPS